MTTPKAPPSLISKLCEIMTAVDHVEKKGYTSSPAGTYHFARDVDVSNALRSELASRNVFLASSITRIDSEVYETRNGGRGSMHTVYTLHKFIDGESGESLDFTWASQGMDGQDKGVSKAATSALKYALLKQFLIPTGDDPDENKVAKNDQPTGQQRQRQQQAKPPHPPGDLEHMAGEATADDWSLFWAKAKGELKLDSAGMHALLGVPSIKGDMPFQSLQTILEWAEARIDAATPGRARLVPTGQTHERS